MPTMCQLHKIQNPHKIIRKLLLKACQESIISLARNNNNNNNNNSNTAQVACAITFHSVSFKKQQIMPYKYASRVYGL